MDGMDEAQSVKFEEEIGMRRDPEKEAVAKLRAFQQAAGMVFADPDAPVAPDAKSMAAAADEEIGGTWLGGPQRG